MSGYELERMLASDFDGARLCRYFAGILLALATALQIVALSSFYSDQRYLGHLFDRIASPSSEPSSQVKQALAFLRQLPAKESGSYFLISALSFLRPTARQVAEQGGDCGDRARLLVRLFSLRGIEASKWALYSNDLRPEHAVMQIITERGPMAVDPLFGLWFPRPGGGYFGIEDLRRDSSLLSERIDDLRARGEQPGAGRLEFYPLDTYIYDHARTMNWEKWPGGTMLYAFLFALLGARVDRIPRASFLEEPALIVIAGTAALQTSILLAFAWPLRRWARS